MPEKSTEPRRRKALPPPDPRYRPALIDAHILDLSIGEANVAAVERILDLARTLELMVLLPCSVKHELDRPETPADVKRRANALIYSLKLELTADEAKLHREARALLQGNAKPGKHAMDAFHLVEAAKWGSFFVTLDGRINRKAAEIQGLLPGLWIVSPVGLLAIFDHHRATEAEP